jgi:hypothetical protein
MAGLLDGEWTVQGLLGRLPNPARETWPGFVAGYERQAMRASIDGQLVPYASAGPTMHVRKIPTPIKTAIANGSPNAGMYSMSKHRTAAIAADPIMTKVAIMARLPSPSIDFCDHRGIMPCRLSGIR